jgi:hypothetical protein
MNRKEWTKKYKKCRWKWATRPDYAITGLHGNLMCGNYVYTVHRCMFKKCPLLKEKGLDAKDD